MSTVHVFVSYSHADSRWVEGEDRVLIPWLAQALKTYDVQFWYDHALKQLPGVEYTRHIKEEIDRAQCALLLVSQDFLISEFIRQYELPWIRERIDRGELILIPVLVGPVLEGELGWLEQRQIIPGKPTPLINYINDPARWLDVRNEILRAIKSRILLGRHQDKVPTRIESEEPKPQAETKTEKVPSSPQHLLNSPPPPVLDAVAPDSSVVEHKVTIPTETVRLVSAENASLAIDETTIEARSAVRSALGKIVLEKTEGWGGVTVKDRNSGRIWSELAGLEPRSVLAALLEISDDPKTTDDDLWKTIALLGYGIRTPVGRTVARSIAENVVKHVARVGYAQVTAMKCIDAVPLPMTVKWELLFPQFSVTTGRSLFGLIALADKSCPSSERNRLSKAMVDVLEYESETSIYGPAYGVLAKHKYREGLARLREIVRVGDLDRAYYASRLLSEWGDVDSAPAIRDAITNHRYTDSLNLVGLLKSLYLLEKTGALPLISEILLETPEKVQICFMNEGIGRGEVAMCEFAKKLLESTPSQELRNAAAKYVGNP